MKKLDLTPPAYFEVFVMAYCHVSGAIFLGKRYNSREAAKEYMHVTFMRAAGWRPAYLIAAKEYRQPRSPCK